MYVGLGHGIMSWSEQRYEDKRSRISSLHVQSDAEAVF